MFKKFALAAALAASVASGASAADVVVSSKIDTEGDAARQHHLRRAQRQRHQGAGPHPLGTTPVVRKAITAGEIDIYPEYTGNAGFFFNKADDPVWKDAAARAMTWRRSSTTTPTRSSG